ncbi:MAG: cache domain-containing protein [Sulfurospirillum sp.]|nr:cache domain-containing protein [Sulfurospirillum sp.]
MKSRKDLDKLNKNLAKVTLTGKISSLSVAKTLFEFMENTQVEFSILKDKLTDALLEEDIKRATSLIKGRTQVVIDILIRNLFERTADISFLATDYDIIELLTAQTITQEQKDFMEDRLQEYVLKYSVYDEIILLNTQGTVIMNLDKNNRITHSKDMIIAQTIESKESFCEIYRDSDLQQNREKSLIFTSKIKSHSGSVVGVLCLCFKIEDEMSKIFDKLEFNDSTYALLDSNGQVLISNHKTNKISLDKYKEDLYFDKTSLCSIAQGSSYQGYKGEGWNAFSSISYQKAFEVPQNPLDFDLKKYETTSLVSDKLQTIKIHSEDITEDLMDVALNGEIIASKTRTYSLNPILENLRIITQGIHKVIQKSSDEVFNILFRANLEELSHKASLCIEIMDRNLYERANDARWWALETRFRQELESSETNKANLTSILEYINTLYTVYTNIFIFDKNQKIIAVSNKNEQRVIGTVADGGAYSYAISNRDSQKYFVTPFEKTALYSNKETYIYTASITSLSRGDALGGIGAVFDSKVEFKAILEDVLTPAQQGLFCDEHGVVISTYNIDISIGDIFEPCLNHLPKELNSKKSTIISIDEDEYLMGICSSDSYREYKKEDGYSNLVYAVILMKI